MVLWFVHMKAFIRRARRLLRLDQLLAIGVMLSLTLLAAAEPALADKRIALVIGNANYQHAKGLEAAVGAGMVGAALQSVGFTLAGGAVQTNLDKAGLDRAIQNFGRQIADADVALIYYAGHAVQLRGSDYLTPVDADPTSEADVDAQMLHVGLLLSELTGSARRLNLVVLDACHDNPFEARGLTGLQPGLAATHLPDNTLIAYPAQPDTAAPSTSDTNNVFAMAFAEAIRKPGRDLLDVFNDVGLTVKRQTNGAQQPFVSFSPNGTQFQFVAATSPAAGGVGSGIVALPDTPKTTNGAVAGRAVLYDEDPNDPKGVQYEGFVVWRAEQIKASGVQKAGLALRADVDIPARRLKLRINLRRNTDPSLPASHTAELTFLIPPDFLGQSVSKVPGVLMKSSEQARGTPLAGLTVRVAGGFFLLGLSDVESDRQRNMEMLREREWFDIPLVYENQRRGILAIAKGVSGDRAFADVLAAWDKEFGSEQATLKRDR